MTTTSPSSSSLSLKSLTQSLHSSSSTWTLRELVPIHKAVLSVWIDIRNNPITEQRQQQPTPAIATTPLPVLQLELPDPSFLQYIQQLGYETAWTECDAFLSNGSSSQKLLAVQFLLQVVMRQKDRCGGWMWSTALKLLLDNDSDEELVEAVLDAILVEDGPESLPAATTLHATLAPSPTWSSKDAKRNGRIVVRLLEYCDNHQQSLEEEDATTTAATNLRQLLTEYILYYGSQKSLDASLLGTIQQEWLPCILTHHELVLSVYRAVADLWVQSTVPISARPVNTSSSNNNTSWMMVPTSILCAILPSVMQIGLDSTQQHIPNSTAATTAWLWELIFTCLSQGLRIHKKRSWIVETSRKTILNTNDNQNPAECKLLRRRGLYLLRVLVDHRHPSNDDDDNNNKSLLLWSKYVACLETMEMERMPHLVDQVWDTVAEIGSQLRSPPPSSDVAVVASTTLPPPLSWRWFQVMLARVITSDGVPALRKLALYRLFQGQGGILVLTNNHTTSDDEPIVVTKTNRMKKKQAGKRPAQAVCGHKGAPLRLVTVDFVLETVLPAFDTLDSSVGSMMHLQNDGKELVEDMNVLLRDFLGACVEEMRHDKAKCESFFRGVLSREFLGTLARKTAILVVDILASHLKDKQSLRIPVSNEVLLSTTESFESLTTLECMIVSHREALLKSLATILAFTVPIGQIPPESLLRVLALFPIPRVTAEPTRVNGDAHMSTVQASENLDMFSSLRSWLLNMLHGNVSTATSMGAAIATAYVDGRMHAQTTQTTWEPSSGLSQFEVNLGKAVVLFCYVATTLNDSSNNTAGELLWPAIYKGASFAAIATMAGWRNAHKVSRAIVLLESGCLLRLVSGTGNGDLIVDSKTGQMMPPPPNIEAMLGGCVSFLMHNIQFLLASESESHSSEPRHVASTFVSLVGKLRTLHEGFPSSLSVSGIVEDVLRRNLEIMSMQPSPPACKVYKSAAAVLGALSCGAEIEGSQLLSACSKLLHMKSSGSFASIDDLAARSAFEYARWGSLAILLPKLLSEKRVGAETRIVVDELLDKAPNAVQSTPAEGLFPLFDCILTAVAFLSPSESERQDFTLSKEGMVRLSKAIASLLRLVEDRLGRSDCVRMLDEFSALVFQPRLLLDEARRYEDDKSCATPVRDAFRHLLKLAGRQRPHILNAAMCRIASAWLGLRSDSSAGLGALPYRDDICNLLLHKEEQLREEHSNQQSGKNTLTGTWTSLPTGTDQSSQARGYALVFFSMLPDADKLTEVVLSGLVHRIILFLLREVQITTSKDAVMVGTIEYCRKIRGWQALCVLSRFVTSEVVEEVCSELFVAIAEQSHGQIRYFMEVFTIQCARRHPAVFAKAIVDQLVRTDLNLQQVSTLMIVTGNLIVGRFQQEFSDALEASACSISLADILSGAIPWLGSTQGFSKYGLCLLRRRNLRVSFNYKGRATAQLLVHRLIPRVVDVRTANRRIDRSDSDWYLSSIYRFLETNPEMRKLRAKQLNFFEHYDVDTVCTPGGVLQMPVDSGREAFPDHMADILKRSLQEVYEESHDGDAPSWKQMEELIGRVDVSSGSNSAGDVNFQRKVIPVDALNLAMEDLVKSHLRNRAGRTKQQLIICASFIEKVPNLGGLARTAEIFAADRLVIPDIRVAKMDNFKSLSVGAGDWIDIEECREENLLTWLRQRQREGYCVVGLEQTSSSISIESFTFPDQPIVLLLGKEKEGIPIEYLNAVDQCIEIPQSGIIRSLNVHVSGAIAIWEHTRQRLLKG